MGTYKKKMEALLQKGKLRKDQCLILVLGGILLCVIAATRHSILTTLLQIANVRRNMKRFCLFCTCDAVYLLQIIRQQIQGLIVCFERLFRKLLHAAMGQELFDLSVNFTHKKTPQFIRHANPIN